MRAGNNMLSHLLGYVSLDLKNSREYYDDGMKTLKSGDEAKIRDLA